MSSLTVLLNKPTLGFQKTKNTERTALEVGDEAREASGAAGPVGGRRGRLPLHLSLDGLGLQRIAGGRTATATVWNTPGQARCNGRRQKVVKKIGVKKV